MGSVAAGRRIAAVVYSREPVSKTGPSQKLTGHKKGRGRKRASALSQVLIRRIMSGEQRRMVAKRDVDTQRLSETLYREVMRRSDPEQDWWVTRDVIERELGMNTDDLFDAAELLIEDRWVVGVW